ncbi:MAG: hypothetical protein U0L04_01565 [Bacteroidaceae bacterium]|jgi:hypothetical protein|nr:hypothetical protein [Bacteroidaceae bacterium]
MEEQKKTQVLGATFYGSVTFNGPMFDIHDNEHVHIHSEQPSAPKKKKEAEANHLPDVLHTDKAQALHAKLCEAGMVDVEWQPVGLSFTEKGTLIEYVADKLDIRTKWKFFGALWHVDSETLRTSKARGLEQDKTWAFRSRLESL